MQRSLKNVDWYGTILHKIKLYQPSKLFWNERDYICNIMLLFLSILCMPRQIVTGRTSM